MKSEGQCEGKALPFIDNEGSYIMKERLSGCKIMSESADPRHHRLYNRHERSEYLVCPRELLTLDVTRKTLVEIRKALHIQLDVLEIFNACALEWYVAALHEHRHLTLAERGQQACARSPSGQRLQPLNQLQINTGTDL
jgi:hypothetical protein